MSEDPRNELRKKAATLLVILEKNGMGDCLCADCSELRDAVEDVRSELKADRKAQDEDL